MNASPARARMAQLYLADETQVIEGLIDKARLTPAEKAKTESVARDLVQKVRAGRRRGGLDAFLHQYALTTEEGVVLMCLAEALLRVPDAETADKLIKDKVGHARWDKHLGQSPSLFVNASTWGLLLTGRVVRLDEGPRDWSAIFKRIVTRSGEPVIRQAMNFAMRIMGGQFVLGRTIDEALARGEEWAKRGFRFSFDMLGEAAVTAEDAERYFIAYRQAIAAIGRHADPRADIFTRNSISVKLSALHPRFEYLHRDRVFAEMVPKVVALGRAARDAGIGFTIDAEEADRLDLQLDVFEAVGVHSDLKGWEGLGLAIQAYGKRCMAVIDNLAEMAKAQQRRIPTRLVKGAYWDSEIKRAQEQGIDGYPVFTRKASTDVSYLACARALLANPQAFFAMFATHNAHTLAAVRSIAGERKDYEFQRLHGMGEALYDEAVGADKLGVQCRIYAPVGAHEDLLAYLVRRLLENGANTSFVNRLADDDAPIADIIADPVEQVEAMNPKPHPKIPLPANLFGDRKNSRGIVLSDPAQSEQLMKAIHAAVDRPQEARPLIGGKVHEGGKPEPVFDPSKRSRQIGTVTNTSPELVERALVTASAAQGAWDALRGDKRADILERAADLYEKNSALLIGLCIREAGKTAGNGLADVREAIDFLRYYAALARADFAEPKQLPGPTGERNELSMHGRGVFAAISPWNFPVAIFTGQIAGALAAGNAVVAKPAERTSLVAYAATRLMHEAGVPGDVLHLVPGRGSVVGTAMVKHPATAGVVFTGGTDTGHKINRMLAERDGRIVTFIAETGGLNAMIADSTALPEQLVKDAVTSAFDSAGQRCSALRVLFVQRDIADRVIGLIKGATAELKIGDPMKLDTDIGPVIDGAALNELEAHAKRMMSEGRLIAEAKLSDETKDGFFFAPRAFEIDAIARLEREVFGPILHVVRYDADKLDKVCDAINATGYGLTLGVHTRVQETADFIRARARVGNLYVNRNQIGAVVGVQPFGGEGLSGTGPKAGGPHYLHRFAVERTACTNTTAAGGNASLLSLGESGT